MKTINIKDKYDFFYFLKSLIKYMSGPYDSHTTIFPKNQDYNLPIELRFIEGNLYINNCKDLLFKKSLVKKINGIDISILIKK